MEWLEGIWRGLYEDSAAAGSFSLFVLASLALIFMFLLSIVGCILPVIPGPALAFCAILLWKLTISTNAISWLIVIVCFFLTVAAQLLDYWLPMKYTPTRSGAVGAFIGVLAGAALAIFFPPFAIFAIFLSPLVFAFLFEYMSDANFQKAWKSGKGAFWGTLLSVLAKVFIIFIMISLVVADISVDLILR